ncbi:MAG: hypothetical protein U0354_19670 [Candidatus Sericytochromatia bacterium]
MSIGFITSGTTSRTVDIYSGGGNRSVDLALQNVLNRYDKVKTDLDRLVDQAQKGTYDITSRQHYNSYNKESVNGWAENWYAEYRAVLALRADALQKKLQSSYNRVLERSAYADMNPDRQSVFAPYSNRTFKDDQSNDKILNNKMRIANVMMVDTELNNNSSTNNPPPGYTQVWDQAKIHDYLWNSYADVNKFPPEREQYTAYEKTGADGRDTNVPYHSYSEYTDASPPTTTGSDMPDWRWADGHVPSRYWDATATPPAWVNGSTSQTESTRNNQRNEVERAIMDATSFGPPGNWPPPPSTEPELSEYWDNRDAAIEAGLQTADLIWKGGVDDADGDDPDTINDDYRDFLNPLNPDVFYKPVFNAVSSFKPGQTSTAPSLILNFLLYQHQYQVIIQILKLC